MKYKKILTFLVNRVVAFSTSPIAIIVLNFFVSTINTVNRKLAFNTSLVGDFNVVGNNIWIEGTDSMDTT